MSKLESKIAALLAKAESTTHPEEAEAFMAKAEELMLRHGIERANLDAKRPGQKREEITQVRIHLPNGHGYAPAQAAICHALADAFSVRTLQSIQRQGARVIFIYGHESDVAKAHQLAESLVEQAHKQAVAWWKTEGKHTVPEDTSGFKCYVIRREFIYAFASGVRARLAETLNRVVAEAETGTELVLADRQQRVSNWLDENVNYGKSRSSNRSTGNYAAHLAGNAAGREAVAPKELRS